MNEGADAPAGRMFELLRKDPYFQKLVAYPRQNRLWRRGRGPGDFRCRARVGLRTSAIRYYEQIGILPPAMRKNGQRRYDKSALFRLPVVQRARETGFTLEEIRELFFGFPAGTSPPKRWHQLSQRKIAETAGPDEAA
jgi:hypothetical protein